MIGSKEIIGFELGEKVDGSADLFELEIWVLNERVTCIDNIAYLKSVLHYIKYDIESNRDISKFKKYFESLTAESAHEFILSTRDSDSKNYDIENDEILPNQQYLNWGPNTDNVACFVIPREDSVYITLEFFQPEDKAGNIKSKKIDYTQFNKTFREFVEYAEQRI